MLIAFERQLRSDKLLTQKDSNYELWRDEMKCDLQVIVAKEAWL